MLRFHGHFQFGADRVSLSDVIGRTGWLSRSVLRSLGCNSTAYRRNRRWTLLEVLDLRVAFFAKPVFVGGRNLEPRQVEDPADQTRGPKRAETHPG